MGRCCCSGPALFLFQTCACCCFRGPVPGRDPQPSPTIARRGRRLRARSCPTEATGAVSFSCLTSATGRGFRSRRPPASRGCAHALFERRTSPLPSPPPPPVPPAVGSFCPRDRTVQRSIAYATNNCEMFVHRNVRCPGCREISSLTNPGKISCGAYCCSEPWPPPQRTAHVPSRWRFSFGSPGRCLGIYIASVEGAPPYGRMACV